jgi:hypothetical protein
MKVRLSNAFIEVPPKAVPAPHPFSDLALQIVLKMGFSFAKVRAVNGEESTRRP